MTKEELSQARRTVAQVLRELEPLRETLLGHGPMLKGYLDSKPRTCGTPGCRCARGKKHAAWVLRIPQGGSSSSRSIPKAAHDRLEPLAKEYRRFHQALARWRRLVREADQALRDIEAGRLVDPEVELGRKHGK